MMMPNGPKLVSKGLLSSPAIFPANTNGLQLTANGLQLTAFSRNDNFLIRNPPLQPLGTEFAPCS